MVDLILEMVNVAVLITVSAVAWKGSRLFTLIQVKLERNIKVTEKMDETLGKHADRLAGIEGELRRVNGRRGG